MDLTLPDGFHLTLLNGFNLPKFHFEAVQMKVMKLNTHSIRCNTAVRLIRWYQHLDEVWLSTYSQTGTGIPRE